MKLILLIPVLYLLFYSVYWISLLLVSMLPSGLPSRSNAWSPKMLIVLPAYKPGKIFLRVMDAVQAAIGNRQAHVLVLLQDAGDAIYANHARSLGFMVEEKSFAHLPGNSYQHALRHLAHTIEEGRRNRVWDPAFVMLVDKDNVLDANFFNNIPAWVYDRYDVIQSQRVALGTGTPVAFFDAMSERLNDRMFRIAKMYMGAMIEISGSGALVDTDVFLHALRTLDDKAPGFDKNLMVRLLADRQDIRTIYWQWSTLSEEKTEDMKVHRQQRIRWFGEQYFNATHHAGELLKASLRYRRWSPLDYLITLWRPPRSLQLMLAPLLGVAETVWYLFSGEWFFGFPFCTVAGLLTLGAVALFLLREGRMMQALRYSFTLPPLIWNNFFSVKDSMKQENLGKFIHTSHRL